MKTTTPLRCGIIDRSATSRVIAHEASTASRWTARQPFGEIASAGAVNCPPALLTRMSIVPKRSTRSVDERLDLVELADVGRDGEARATAGLDLALHRGERLLALPADRRRDAPVRASSSAVAAPIPVPPPVTRATLPSFASDRSTECPPEAVRSVSLGAHTRSLPETRARCARDDPRAAAGPGPARGRGSVSEASSRHDASRLRPRWVRRRC